ncbi:MAG: polyhydroxyalkanoic acid system family protein [Betaproteobacteria bacterium]|nr:polyhydroxyalkanoic acid system family protein [Betaproteobacteria bacterium]
MSEIRVSRAHHTTLKKARKGAEHIAEELGEEFGLDHEWDGGYSEWLLPDGSGLPATQDTT